MILIGYFFSYVFLIAGRLPKNDNVSWRRDSCLKDELPGGYYMILSIFGHGSSSSWAQNTFSKPLVPQQIPKTRLLHLLMEQMVVPQTHRPSSPSYSSTCYWDEFWWSGPWLYNATGNSSYLVTNPLLANQIDASLQGPDCLVVSWDNKLPKIVHRFRLSFIKISQRDRQNLVLIPTSFSEASTEQKVV
ncbi:hypothetical protein SO802_033361 [Lithocarpus litseifolius]|uniref:Homing endonuclease LAGLIDADG domain-containing protein n=1 Tax=Lithocarpus litseifolius TaxID=425828 RepID=A0AAW2BCP8_9ROSI